MESADSQHASDRGTLIGPAAPLCLGRAVERTGGNFRSRLGCSDSPLSSPGPEPGATQHDQASSAPTIAGATSRTASKNSTYTITGTGIPGQTLTVHFHKAGTAANDYSLLRTVTVAKNGGWSRSYVASVDYRFYASLPNGQVSPKVLVQAR